MPSARRHRSTHSSNEGNGDRPISRPTRESSAIKLQEINEKLKLKVEVLKEKIDIDKRNHSASKTKLLREGIEAQQDKRKQLQQTKEELENKKEAVNILADDSEKKGEQIKGQQNVLDRLAEDMRLSEKFAEEMQDLFDMLRSEKSKFESREMYEEKEREIKALQDEVDCLKQTLSTLKAQLLELLNELHHQDEYLICLEEEKNYFENLNQDLKKVSGLANQEVKDTLNSLKKQSEVLATVRKQQDILKQIAHDMDNQLSPKSGRTLKKLPPISKNKL